MWFFFNTVSIKTFIQRNCQTLAASVCAPMTIKIFLKCRNGEVWSFAAALPKQSLMPRYFPRRCPRCRSEWNWNSATWRSQNTRTFGFKGVLKLTFAPWLNQVQLFTSLTFISIQNLCMTEVSQPRIAFELWPRRTAISYQYWDKMAQRYEGCSTSWATPLTDTDYTDDYFFFQCFLFV